MRARSPGHIGLMAHPVTPARDVALSLAPLPISVGIARRALSGRGLAPAIEHSVLLLTSEVVGNAVRHADLAPDEPILLRAQVSAGSVRVEVSDAGAGFDPSAVDSDGYAIKLLERLAERWGVECGDDGCHVWFEVGQRRGRFVRVD